jgi:hypothetical protein
MAVTAFGKVLRYLPIVVRFCAPQAQKRTTKNGKYLAAVHPEPGCPLGQGQAKTSLKRATA